jgi:hypothetical protein
MGIGGPFPGGKARPGRDVDHSPPSSAEVVKFSLHLYKCVVGLDRAVNPTLNPQPWGPGPRICDPRRQGDPAMPQVQCTHFSRFLRHAWAALGVLLSSGHHTDNTILMEIFYGDGSTSGLCPFAVCCISSDGALRSVASNLGSMRKLTICLLVSYKIISSKYGDCL